MRRTAPLGTGRRGLSQRLGNELFSPPHLTRAPYPRVRSCEGHDPCFSPAYSLQVEATLSGGTDPEERIRHVLQTASGRRGAEELPEMWSGGADRGGEVPGLRRRLAGAGRARTRRPGCVQGPRRSGSPHTAARTGRLNKGAWAGASNPLNGAPAHATLPRPLPGRYPAPHPRDVTNSGHVIRRGLQ